jgi:hypothetical protein
MPQLDLYSFFSLTIWSIVGFFVLLFMMHTYYLPRIGRALKLREQMRRSILFQEMPKDSDLLGSYTIFELELFYASKPRDIRHNVAQKEIYRTK